LHEGSGALALMAIYAGTVEKFWPMNDYLFYFARLADQLDLNSVAEKIGIDNHTLIASMTNPLIRKKLRHDIADGISLGVSGTPTFLIEGNLYSGQIPADILERVIE
jgi:2-hydroxychromene-2-carboxylate isomerase